MRRFSFDENDRNEKEHNNSIIRSYPLQEMNQKMVCLLELDKTHLKWPPLSIASLSFKIGVASILFSRIETFLSERCYFHF
jgi:hypothetical protein